MSPVQSDGPQVEELTEYILRFQPHCDRHASLAQPRDKSVLVIGSEHGTEMLWCLRESAAEVVGIDIAPRTPGALRLALDELGIDDH